jgi:excisionase family DNA binding protein
MSRELTSPLSCKEAARALGLAEPTIRAWIGKRKIAYLRLGRAIRIPCEEVARLLSENLVPALKPKERQ